MTDLLVEHFADIMNVEYTAAMEDELDEIEEGKDSFLNTLNQFWKKFEKDLTGRQAEMKDVKRVEEETDEVCDKCDSPMVMKWGRYGKFLACSGYPECKTTRQLAGGEGTDTPEASEEGPVHLPQDAEMLVPRKGRFGFFLACTQYPECKVDEEAGARRRGKLELEKLKPIDENCPECKKPPAWRKGRFGNFIACSDYPTCKYIKKKEAKDIGLLCPECHEGQVVERKGQFGRLVLRVHPVSGRASSPPITGPSPSRAPSAAVPTCSSRRPRSRARSPSVRRRVRLQARGVTPAAWPRPSRGEPPPSELETPMTSRATVVGAGLAGSEATWQLARRGVGVDLYEMRPVRPTPVHQTGDFAELVCSNSLRGNDLDQAAGLLKEEMRRLRLARHPGGRRGPGPGRQRTGRGSGAVRPADHRGGGSATGGADPPRGRWPGDPGRSAHHRRHRAAHLGLPRRGPGRFVGETPPVTSTTR